MKVSIKKYWKIILTAIICIFIILVLSYVSAMGEIAFSTIKNNNSKKDQVIKNIEETIRFYENRDNILCKAKLDIVGKLSTIIYENDPVYDEKLLNEYLSDAGMEDIVILDQKRTVKYIRGCENYNLSNDHFSDSYYDAVFADTDLNGSDAINVTELKDYGRDALFIKVKDDYWVYVFQNSEVVKYKNESYFWETVLENVWVGDYSNIGVVNTDSGEIIYCWDETLQGKIINIDKNDNYLGKINDKIYYISSIHSMEDVPAEVVALTPIFVVADMIKDQLITIAVLIFAAITIMIALIIFLREDAIDAREEVHFLRKNFLKIQLKKYAIVGLVVSLILAGALILVSELDYMTNIEADMSSHIDKTVKLFDDYYADTIAIDDMTEDRYYTYGRITDTFLKYHPDYATKEGLGYLASLFGVSNVTLFDSEGNTISTSSPLDHLAILSDKESPLYDLRYVLMGKEEVSVNSDTRILPEDVSIYAIPSRNENGVADGIVAVEVVPEKIERFEPTGLLRDGSGVVQFCVDEDGTILIFYDKKMVGKNVSTIGITPDMIYDGSTDKYNYNGKDYAALVRSSKAGYTVLVSRYNSFASNVIGTGLTSTFLFIIAAMIFAYDGLGSVYKFVSRAAENNSSSKGNNEVVKWANLNAGGKMKRVINFFIYCFSAYFIISWCMINSGIGVHDTLDYIFNGDWDKSVNIFSFVSNVLIIMVYYSVIRWIAAILTRIAIISGPSGETISRLAANVIKYLGAIICIYQVVMNFGVDAKTALTSIGIAGFGLTFGAQDMIKDIIAGIFILFEGNYKVGDMLIINGDWYWVRSIGIRATRVEAWGQVRVINNSQMASAVNIENASDVAGCEVFIGNEYNLDDIEEILNYELPLLKSKLPSDVPLPKYDGIREIDGNGIKIRIETYASPIRKGEIGRILRREVLRIFDKYGIRIASRAYEIVSANAVSEDWDKNKQKRAEMLKEQAEKIRKEIKYESGQSI